ncbi:MAG: pirin family protein [Pseudohongiellaceae bacterium]
MTEGTRPEHRQSRSVEEILTAKPASDGDGVRLLRVFGGGDLSRFDPFLMLDEFGSAEAQDYIGGFPSHPHRGFETVTYMLEGSMEHRDHMDNIGLLEPGDVQWMKAGSGVIHSEMPRQQQGRMRGFQLWLNLPAAEKMTPATYQDIPAADIPRYPADKGAVKAIAGETAVNGAGVTGAVTGLSTDPVYLDIQLPASAGQKNNELRFRIKDGYTALVYVYDGKVAVGEESVSIAVQQLARLSRQGDVLVSGSDVRFLLIAGKPIGEPIVQYGPFVMNTREEVNLALREYRDGTLVSPR